MKTKVFFICLAIVAAAFVIIGCPREEENAIDIGALATLEGAFAALGEDGIRGVELALQEFDYTVGDREINLITGSSDASPDSAIRAARKLIEQDGVQVLIGPLSGSEGIALKDYAKTQPQATFLKRIVGRTGYDIARTRVQFLPFFDRRCAVDGGIRRL